MHSFLFRRIQVRVFIRSTFGDLASMTFIFCLTDGNSKMGWQDQIARKIKQVHIVEKTQ
jgi:hypothetical protein